jgi:hypothetical protein
MIVVLLLFLTLAGNSDVLASGPADSACLECHGAAGGPGPGIAMADGQPVVGSAHAGVACAACHVESAPLPHSAILQTVDCSSCHSEQAADYRRSVHGERKVAADGASSGGASATCAECHGTHAIETVGLLHSPQHRLGVVDLCGKCHPAVAATYTESIHGQAAGAGAMEAPVCTDCHGEHDIASPLDPLSSVAPRNIPTTCASCHEEERIAARYGLPPRRYTTYLDSYHGVVNLYGDAAVANCSSCHGVHDIRPSTDPQSAIHADNLGATCGSCHPGLEEGLADARIHVEATPESSRGVFYVRAFYTYFIGGLMVCFVAYMSIEIYGTVRRRRPK